MHISTGRSAWHTTNFCFDFSNPVHHAHVQPLTLSTASSKVEVTHQMNSQAVSPHHTGCRQRLCLNQTLHLCLSKTLHLCLGWTLPHEINCAQSLS